MVSLQKSFHCCKLGFNSLQLSLIHRSAGHGSSVGCASAWYVDGHRFDPHVWQHSFKQDNFDGHSLPLIQEGLLPLTGERMCMKYWQTA